jgi:hypothetical protein
MTDDMKKPSYYVRQVEQVWKEDDYDRGWFLTSEDEKKMTDRDVRMYMKGLRAMLRCLKRCVDDEAELY